MRPPCSANRRLDSVREKCPQFGVGSFFVMVHKPGIASHVGGQYRRQPTLDPEWPLLHHGMQSSSAYSTTDETAVPTAATRDAVKKPTF